MFLIVQQTSITPTQDPGLMSSSDLQRLSALNQKEHNQGIYLIEANKLSSIEKLLYSIIPKQPFTIVGLETSYDIGETFQLINLEVAPPNPAYPTTLYHWCEWHTFIYDVPVEQQITPSFTALYDYEGGNAIDGDLWPLSLFTIYPGDVVELNLAITIPNDASLGTHSVESFLYCWGLGPNTESIHSKRNFEVFESQLPPPTIECPVGWHYDGGYCVYDCIDITWTPSSSTVCDSILFIQTSNCGSIRQAVGVKDCRVQCDTIGTICSSTQQCMDGLLWKGFVAALDSDNCCVYGDCVTTSGILEEDIALLEQLLQEKMELVEFLDLSITSQGEVIDSLEITLNEKIQIVQALELEIDNQIILVSQLETTLAEKIIIVQTLTTNIDEQAALINALTINLQEKADLVSSLQVTNEEQAALISAMELSFVDQAGIIDALNKEVEDDAIIIQNLDLTIAEEGILISNLELTIVEQAEIISNLELSTTDQATLIQSLKLTLEEEGVIIANLRLELSEEQQLVEDLTDKISEQQQLLETISQTTPTTELTPREVGDGVSKVLLIGLGIIILLFILSKKP